MERFTENWLDIGFLSWKSIYINRMLCVRLIVKSHQEVVEEEYQELIEKDVGEGNID